MFRNRILSKLFRTGIADHDQRLFIYILSLIVESFRTTGAWNLPVLDKGYYIGFISKSRIFSTYKELLVQFSEE